MGRAAEAVAERLGRDGLAAWLDEPAGAHVPALRGADGTLGDAARRCGDASAGALLAQVERAVALHLRCAAHEVPGPGADWGAWLDARGLGWFGRQRAARYRGPDGAVAALLSARIPEAHRARRLARDRVLDAVREELVATLDAPPPRAPGPAAPAWALEVAALGAAEGVRAAAPPGEVGVHALPEERRVSLRFREAGCSGDPLAGELTVGEDGAVALAACPHPGSCGRRVRVAEIAARWLAGEAGRRFCAAGSQRRWERALAALATAGRAGEPQRAVVARGRDVAVTLLDGAGRALGGPAGPLAALRVASRLARVELDGRKVRLLECALEAELVPDPEGAALFARIGPWLGDAAAFQALRRTVDVVWLPDADVARWAALDGPAERVAPWIGTRFPAAEVRRAADVLRQAGVPTAVAEGVLGEPRAWDGRLRLRLAFEPESGLLARIRVAMPDRDVEVGRGELVHAALVDGAPIEVTRDPAAEERAARDLVARLGGGHAVADDAWAIRVPDLAGALALAERLAGLGDRVAVAWERPLPEVVTVRRRDVTLQLRPVGWWFELGGGAVGAPLPLDELLAALRDRRRLVPISPERVVRLAEDLFEGLAEVADAAEDGPGGPRVGRVHGARLSVPEVAPAAELAVPEGLTAALRPYQVDGFRFLAARAAFAPGAVLADDMGLGKTVQAIALLCARPGPSLVVAPTSVVGNWRAELARFAPGLRVLARSGAGRPPEVAAGPGEVVVTSWDLLVRDEAALAAVAWDTVVLDEAHLAKNAGTRRARAAAALRAGFRVALTGTPVENHLGELWSVFALAVPGLLPREELFRARFQVPIERDRDPERLARLRALVGPFLLRRTKDAVAAELPPRTELVEEVDLRPAERRLYEQVRSAVTEALAGPGRSLPQDRVRIFAALTRLRQAACDARLIDPASRTVGAKIARLIELARAFDDAGERILVFSEFTSLLDLVAPALDAAGLAWLRLDGSTPARRRDALVAAFQAGAAPVFLVSRKAGGVGVNLTAATAVVHLDPWWNPAAEDQATDRAHRIGQTRPVTVVRLLARGTLEERVAALQRDKRALVAGVLDDTAGGALDLEALRALLAPTAWDEAPGHEAVLDAIDAEEAALDAAPDRAPEERRRDRALLRRFRSWAVANPQHGALADAVAASGLVGEALDRMTNRRGPA